MRVTCDIDTKNKVKLVWSLIKGCILCGKFPDEIRETKKGYHFIWRGLNINEKRSLWYRRIIGDDPNRIFLDSCSNKRITQVLFSEKRVKYFNK